MSDDKLDKELVLETTSIDQIKARKNNPKKHSEKQINLLMATISKVGYVTPIVIDEENKILSGHGRWHALKKLGVSNVQVVRASNLSAEEKGAYILADNKLAELSKWDKDPLALYLNDLVASDWSPEIFGFSEVEIHNALSLDEPSAQIDALDNRALLKSEAPVTRLGDTWLMKSKDGNHRLLCGDATKAESYAALMDGKTAQVVVTDPPYNVPIVGNVTKSKDHKEFAMASGEMSEGQFEGFLHGVMRHMCDHSQQGSVHYIFMSWHHLQQLLNAGERAYSRQLNLCVWVKPNAGLGTTYRSQHELVAVYKHGDAPHINNFGLGGDGRWRSNVWQYPGGSQLHASEPDVMGLHPTVKPVRMIIDALRDCSRVGGIVLDPFCGSGTILLAAHKTRRLAYAMEIDPQYVDVAIRGWQKLTGQQAVLVRTGKTFDEVAAARKEAK